MKKLIMGMLAVLLVTGCAAGQQSLIKQLEKNPDTDTVKSMESFFGDYAEDPASQIDILYADGKTKSLKDSIQINRMYQDLMQITVKKSGEASSLTTASTVITLTKDDGSSISLQFTGKSLIVGTVAYELTGASDFFGLLTAVQNDALPAHAKDFTSYTALITTLTPAGDQLVADIKFTNASGAPLTEISATVVFVDEAGKILGTKKFSQTLTSAVNPGESYWAKVSCDYKDTIRDVTFQ